MIYKYNFVDLCVEVAEAKGEVVPLSDNVVSTVLHKYLICGLVYVTHVSGCLWHPSDGLSSWFCQIVLVKPAKTNTPVIRNCVPETDFYRQ